MAAYAGYWQNEQLFKAYRPSASEGSAERSAGQIHPQRTAAMPRPRSSPHYRSKAQGVGNAICKPAALRLSGKALAQFAVRRHAAGDENAVSSRDSAAAKVFFIRSPTTAC